ncbi:RNA-binding protein 4F [Modicella reniformis]|uniref:RNA-binding protein 4F n=1 Tax=Modicella reniformis TaxID=1440133 RepID=A0A9P6STC7_9FUNG|nr:RNA-binding protein 4F [Modicella reniformis]
MNSNNETSDNERDSDSEELAMDEVSSDTIATLKTSLKQDPNQYELHTQLIVLLKNTDMLDELRQAREAMSAAFPLTEELWIEWIADESNMAITGDEKKHVLSLYERATSDYLSITIWKSYVSYAIQEYTEYMEHPSNDNVVDMAYLRYLFRKADKSTGHHVSQSHIIWDMQKDFELQQLSSKEPANPEDVDRVKAMFLERITTPHSTLEETFSSLSSFISQYDGDDYESTMVQNSNIVSATRDLLSKLEPFEESLVQDLTFMFTHAHNTVLAKQCPNSRIGFNLLDFNKQQLGHIQKLSGV